MAADMPQVPKDDKFFHDLFANGHQSLYRYIWEISYGSLDLSGSKVDDRLHTMAVTREQSKTMDRRERIRHGIEAAHPDTRGFYKVVVVINDDIDSGSADGNVLMCPNVYNITFLAHEVLHGFSYSHSWDDSSWKNSDCIAW